MQVELKIPEVGESIQEAVLAQWYKNDGDYVEKDEPVFVIETDKVTLEVPSESAGVLHILVEEGETVPIGKVVGTIDTEAEDDKEAEDDTEAETEKSAPDSDKAEDTAEKPDQSEKKEKSAGKPEKNKEADKPETEGDAGEEKPSKSEKKSEPAPAEPSSAKESSSPADKPAADKSMMPSVRRLVKEKGLDVNKITGTGPNGTITKGDVLLYLESGPAERAEQKDQSDRKSEKKDSDSPECDQDAETVTRKPMSPIRKRIASHLLAAKQNTAMLTTFNEIDMGHVMDIRSQYKDSFYKTYNVSLGFMSFFIKATVAALKEFPDINASIEEEDLVYHNYYHIGIAIGAEKGLVVPVIRHADKKSFSELEAAIVEFVDKIKSNKLALKDMEGGTFSITNGGVYGSLLSTPILNMPQSGILGMHKIEDRPVSVDKKVEIRPMMYVALSYDHRIVDGKNAVTFLRRIKEFMENPERIMMEI